MATLSTTLIMGLVLIREHRWTGNNKTSKMEVATVDIITKEFSNRMQMMQMQVITEIKTSLNSSSKCKSAACSWLALGAWAVPVRT